MGEARVSLSGAVENRVLEGLIVFLTERAEGAGVPVPPGNMRGKVAGTRTHLVYAATYKSRKASKGMGSKAGTIRVVGGHRWTYVQPVSKE
jgi:hypothetical protein